MLNSECLRVCHLNVNSLRAHIERVRHFLEPRPPFHVIAMSETKFCPLIDDDVGSFEDYRLFRRDRNTRGGGVGLFFSDIFKTKMLATSAVEWIGKPGLPEFIFSELTIPGIFPIFTATIYRPPHSPFLAGRIFYPV